MPLPRIVLCLISRGVGQSPTNIQRAFSMSEKQRLRNAAGRIVFFGNSKRTLYAQVQKPLP